MDKLPIEAVELFARVAFGNETTSHVIEDQERRGQQDQARLQTLPIKGPRADLETLGFVFGDPVDDLFVKVQFPAGWRKEATDHAMHTNLLDPQGRRRGGIFYKAAFYDRSAHVYPLFCRYIVTTHYGADLAAESHYSRNVPVYTLVKDDATGAILWHSDPLFPTDAADGSQEGRDYWRREDATREEAKHWLEEHYPDYRNPLAYWD